MALMHQWQGFGGMRSLVPVLVPLWSILMPLQGFRTTYASVARVAWNLCISGKGLVHLSTKHWHQGYITIMMTLVMFCNCNAQ